MKVFKTIISSLVCATLICCSGSTVFADEAKTQSKEEVNTQIENSYVRKFSNVNEESKAAYENVKNNAISMSTSTQYVKMDLENNEVVDIETNSLYKAANSTLGSSSSGNRYSWIKLTVESYNMGGSKYLCAGFYEWLQLPFFKGNDVIALGHDSTMSFDTSSAFGFNQCEYFDYSNQVHTITENFRFKDDQKNTAASTNGVAYKFNLPNLSERTAQLARRPTYTGAIYCNGTLNSRSGNIQVSYGHSEVAITTSLGVCLKWKSTGGINFNVIGTQDIATHGDEVN